MTQQALLKACLLTLLLPTLIFASAAQKLRQAAESETVAFLLVTEKETPGIDQARQMVEEAAAMSSVKSVIIEFDRSDPANSNLVKKYRLFTAPVPLVLLIAANGATAGGLPISKATSTKLAQLVPSPKKAEVLKAVQSGQAVYVTASRSGMTTRSDVTKGCAAACMQMQGKCIAVDVDMDDPAEKAFLTQMKVNMQSTEPVTVVINAKGQVTESYTGTVEVDKLITSATTVVASGCCPPGSGKTCGPTKKTKK